MGFWKARSMLCAPLHDADARGAASYAAETLAQRSAERSAQRWAAEARKRLQRLQRLASVGFWELDLRTGIFTASDQVYQICGLEPRVGPEPRDLIGQVADPSDAARLEAARAEALAGGADGIHLDIRIVRPNGEIRCTQITTEITRDNLGFPISIIGTLVDITSRRRIEDPTPASELRSQALHQFGEAVRRDSHVDQIMSTALRLLGESMHASRCVFCHVDADGDGLTIPHDYTNGCGSIVGHARLTDFGPTSLAYVKSGRTLVLRNVRRELSQDEAARTLAIEVEAHITCSLVRNGALRALMAVHQTSPRDWTEAEIELVQEFAERCWSLIEQRAAESKLIESQTLVQFASRVAHIGGWRLTVPDFTVSWSDEVCAIHEVSFGTRPTFDQTIAFFAPEFRELVRSRVQCCAQDGTPFDIEAQLMTASGRRVWVRGIGQAERAATGTIVSVQGALQDITPQRNLEEQLRQSQKMEAVGQLAGGVAHDFNNLLAVVLGCSSLLLLDLPEDDPMRTEIAEIQRAGERANELTRQLLAFSRRQVLQPRVVDWNQILHGMHGMVKRLLGADITLDLQLGSEVGQMLADSGQLEQVVLNLLVNARDAMPSGGTLTIVTGNVELDARHAARLTLTPGRYVVLVVTDSGVGMKSDTVLRVFEPFFTTKKGKGTGLGLSTVHGIVTQSGGHISIESAPGAGTTFRTYLPCVDAMAQTPARSELSSSSFVPLGGSETILVVEDEEQVRNVVRSILRRYGYTVLEAENAGEAFLLCEQYPHEIDLLLTDVVMPRMSGRELAERVVNMRPHTKVVYMSGYTEDATLRHGVAQSGIAFLQKPITAESLLQKIREVLGHPHEGSAGART